MRKLLTATMLCAFVLSCVACGGGVKNGKRDCNKKCRRCPKPITMVFFR